MCEVVRWPGMNSIAAHAWWWLFLLLVVCPVGVNGSLVARAAGPHLELVVSDANPIYANSAGSGIVDRLLAAAMERVGVTYTLARLPSARALLLTNSGVVDGDLLRIAGLEKSYPQLVRVDESWLEMEFGAFTDHPELVISGWADLDHLDVAFITGWRVFEENLIASPRVLRVSSAENLFNLLRLRRVDVILYDLRQGLYHLERLGITTARIAGPPLTTNPVYLYLHRDHAALAQPIAAALRTLKQDGTHQRILQQKVVVPHE